PKWMSEALEHLRTANDQRSWCAVLENWIQLEATLGFPDGGKGAQSRLPIEGRLDEVHAWQKRGKKATYSPDIKSLAEYGNTWLSWWISMQPEWRVGDGCWPLERAEGEETYSDWEALCRGGRTGFFVVVMSLSWW
ncbi:hypothetical protein FA95DRAFT_1473861, partial [Auriscalpium vulgare]